VTLCYTMKYIFCATSHEYKTLKTSANIGCDKLWSLLLMLYLFYSMFADMFSRVFYSELLLFSLFYLFVTERYSFDAHNIFLLKCLTFFRVTYFHSNSSVSVPYNGNDKFCFEDKISFIKCLFSEKMTKYKLL
jgi:hypothetical protein